MQTFIKRSTAVLLASLLFAAPAGQADTASKAAATVELPGQEYSVYRSGHPYRSGRATDSTACQSECNGDAACASWAYVAATLQTGPRCELKRNIGASEYRPGAISGVSSKYYPNGERRPQTAAAATETYPRASFAPYPGSESWPEPYAIPVDKHVLLGQTPKVNAKPLMRAAAPRPTLKPSARSISTPVPSAPVRYAPAPQPTPNAMQPVITRKPVRAPAPAKATTIYAPVIAAPARKAPLPAPITMAAPKPVQQVSPPAAAAKLRKNWTERDYGDQTYSVQETDFIPGDEDAMAGYLDGAPE